VQWRVMSSPPMTMLVPGVQTLRVGRSPLPTPPSAVTGQ